MSSIDNYPQNTYFLIADTTSLELGSHTGASGDLKLCHLRIYHKKSGAFSYTMQLVMSGSQGGTALASSTAVTFSDTAIGQTTDDWLGDITFDMPEYNLLAAETYFFRLEITGYSRPGTPLEDTAYLGVWCDWLEPIGSSNTAAARIALGTLI